MIYLTDFDDLNGYTHILEPCGSNGGTLMIELALGFRVLKCHQSRQCTTGDHKPDGFSYLHIRTLIKIVTHLPNMNPRLVCDQKISLSPPALERVPDPFPVDFGWLYVTVVQYHTEPNQ